MKLGRWQRKKQRKHQTQRAETSRSFFAVCTVVPSLGEEQSEPLVGGCLAFFRAERIETAPKENPIICHAKHPKPPVASLRLFSVGTDACCLEREEKCPQERHGLPTQNVGISHSLCSLRHLVHTTMKGLVFYHSARSRQHSTRGEAIVEKEKVVQRKKRKTPPRQCIK